MVTVSALLLIKINKLSHSKKKIFSKLQRENDSFYNDNVFFKQKKKKNPEKDYNIRLFVCNKYL